MEKLPWNQEQMTGRVYSKSTVFHGSTNFFPEKGKREKVQSMQHVKNCYKRPNNKLSSNSKVGRACHCHHCPQSLCALRTLAPAQLKLFQEQDLSISLPVYLPPPLFLLCTFSPPLWGFVLRTSVGRY